MFQPSNRRSAGDRFIPRRAGQDVELTNFQLLADAKPTMSCITEDSPRYVNFAYINYKRKVYMETLWTTIIPTPRKILCFSDSIKPKLKKVPKEVIANQIWPIKPRKKPLIGAPILVLDMPGLVTNIWHHIADWGKTGFLASVFEQEIYLWHPDMNLTCMLSDTGGLIEPCVKWNRDGTKIAIALQRQGIAVWILEYRQLMYRSKCPCLQYCTITCIEWSLGNKYVCAGCSNGRLTIFSSTLETHDDLFPAHLSAITSIAFSTLDNQFVTTGVDGVIRVWLWPGLERFQIILPSPVRDVAWHPWKDSLLVAGTTEHITLWNTSSLSEIGCTLSDKNTQCDALTWNEITGELVVSYWMEDKQNEGQNKICVLSDFNTVVDALEWHVRRVPYLLWSPDSTQLATAGVDENLCIWNFMGPKKKKKRYHQDPYNFGQCIR